MLELTTCPTSFQKCTPTLLASCSERLTPLSPRCFQWARDVPRTVALVTRAWQRPAILKPDIDADVPKLEFDNRWEGPGDAFQAIVGSTAGLEVQVPPADGGPSFAAPWLAAIADTRMAVWTRLRCSTCGRPSCCHFVVVEGAYGVRCHLTLPHSPGPTGGLTSKPCFS